MAKPNQSAYSRYLPVEGEALRWGLHIIDCGFAEIAPDSDYPKQEDDHPTEYMFTWETGRVLNEYQLIYITGGSGVFESNPTGTVHIEPGDCFLLYPGIWHRYRPDASTGWQENWFGFSGVYADRLMSDFFPPQHSVLKIGYDEGLERQIRSMFNMLQRPSPGHRQIIASQAILALARIRSMAATYNESDRELIEKIGRARAYLLEHSNEQIDMKEVARELGLSYSRFRAVFKAQTGISPHQFQIDIQMNRARDLLSRSTLSITEIAEALGFSSVYYFSRLFKQKTGLSPLAYRNRP